MNKALLFLLLSSTILYSQNKDLITKTFYKQTINNIDKIASENNYGRKESVWINVFFKCDSNGEIFDINVAEESKIFEDEIKEFITQIPKLNPDEYIHKGNIMKYDLSMRFKMASKKELKKMLKNGEEISINYQWFNIKEYYPLKNIEITEFENLDFPKSAYIPRTENCKNIINKIDIKKCVSREVSMYINKNFDTDLLADLPLGRHEVKMTFYVSKNGEIVNISAKGDSFKLNEEGIRVINSFSKFSKAGMTNENSVNIKYTIPIIFSVN